MSTTTTQNNQEGINVLSLFDGISCARLALEKAGIKINKYYSSEICPHALAIIVVLPIIFNWVMFARLTD
jgi:hypothetical protein